ncbi:CBS domain-containing protein [Nocardiopsis ansamitocini]|uniref:Signal transduction protein n=1 Tax=Nocardiopsis ansamitocini TaxID=1670832 RepID=A0A9W6UGT1_9ACTN|nr:CBS domain-containing protein [Nocardiopsis ansamitocini]GLU48031.1 signal transduction protein [Nocardiopsis ansamitocini]
MRIAEILRKKGAAVVTVAPETTVATLITDLARHNIGAMVVERSGEIAGIVSERDVVRRLAERGPEVLSAPVAQIMTAVVVICTPHDTVDTLTVLMTERRVRHVPVIADGGLAGIVSIGDVLKNHIKQLEEHREQLEAYISQG